MVNNLTMPYRELHEGWCAHPRLSPGIPPSPHAPEKLWKWEKEHLVCLLWKATTFGRELAHRYCPTWNPFAKTNQRIWETAYLPRPRSESWATWHAWLDEYRALVRDVQDIYEEHHGRRHTDPFTARQAGQ
jgi:hypothetical protein